MFIKIFVHSFHYDTKILQIYKTFNKNRASNLIFSQLDLILIHNYIRQMKWGKEVVD